MKHRAELGKNAFIVILKPIIMCTCPPEGSELPDHIERMVGRCWMMKTTDTEHSMILLRVTMKKLRTQHTRQTSGNDFKN